MLELKIKLIQELIVAMSMLVALLSAQLEEPKLGAVKTEEETKLEEIKAEQTTYFTLNGKYKQGKGEFGTDPKYRYSITEYSGPKGKGYDIHLVKHTSTTTVEEKHINIGPETYRNQNWVVTYPYPGRPYQASSTK